MVVFGHCIKIQRIWNLGQVLSCLKRVCLLFFDLLFALHDSYFHHDCHVVGQVYREKFEAVCCKIFDFGMKEHERRAKELEEFHACINETKTENKNMSASLIDAFEEYRKRVSPRVDGGSIMGLLRNRRATSPSFLI